MLTPNNSIDTTTGTIALKATFAEHRPRPLARPVRPARVQLGVAHNAVTIPETAVQHAPEGLFVYIVQPDQTAARRDITLGYQGDGQAVVTDGLSGGENVIVAGQVRVQPGQKVDPRPATPR